MALALLKVFKNRRNSQVQASYCRSAYLRSTSQALYQNDRPPFQFGFHNRLPTWKKGGGIQSFTTWYLAYHPA
jgi:hypothetical protein